MRTLLRFLFTLTISANIAMAQGSDPINNRVRVKFAESFTTINYAKNTLAAPAAKTLSIGHKELDKVNSTYGAVKMTRVFPNAGKFEAKHREYGLHLWYDIHLSSTSDLESVIGSYKSLEVVETAEKLSTYSFDGTVTEVVDDNDPRLVDQWHYNNTGQTGGTPGADISLFDAWNTERGDNSVIVSVHDSGIDYTHPDLVHRLWTNPGEIEGDGIDNDNNGYIDDYHGYNFGAAVIGGSGSEIYDNNGHGSHTSGTISAENNNGIGVSGIAGGSGINDGVKVMMLKLGDQYLYNPAPSFVYAADMGAVISSNSWGGGGYDQSLVDAINYFTSEAGKSNRVMDGGLVIFASGNNSSSSKDYKADLDHLLMVSATNDNDQIAWYSNYGDWVDISAPGGETNSTNAKGVLSTYKNQQYAYLQGTSMACPHVSGVAALIVSRAVGSGFTNTSVADILLSTADNIDELNPSYTGEMGAGRLNAKNAIKQTYGNFSGGITISPTQIYQEIDANTNQTVLVKVVNTSAFNLDIEISGEASWIQPEILSVSLKPNEVSKFKVNVTAGEAGSLLSSSLDFSYVSFDSKVTQHLPIQVYSLGKPEINTADSIAFGSQYLGMDTTISLNLKNIGTNYLIVSKITNKNADFVYNFNGDTISPEKNLELPITFKPVVGGVISDTLLIYSNDPNEPIHHVVLIGYANSNTPPTVSISPNQLDFKLPNGQNNKSFTITISNNGDEALKVYSELNPSNNVSISNLTSSRVSTSDSKYTPEAFGKLIGSNKLPFLEKGIAWDGQYFWIKDSNSDQIYQFDYDNGIVLDSITSVAVNSVALDIYGGFLYEHDYRSQIIKYDLSNKSSETLPLDNTFQYFYGMAVDGSGIWMVATQSYQSMFVQLDPESGHWISTSNIGSVYDAYGLERVGNKLYIIDSNAYLKEFTFGSYYSSRSTYIGGTSFSSWDFVYDGKSAWLTNRSSRYLINFDLFPDFTSFYANLQTIQPHSSVNINGSINLNGFDNGITYYDEIVFHSDDPVNPKITLPITATMKGEPAISVVPDALNWPYTFIGETFSYSFDINNSGDDTLSITNIQSDNSLLSINAPGSLKIDPYGHASLPVSAKVTTTDTVKVTMSMTTNDPNYPKVAIPINIIGKYAPKVSIKPDSIAISLNQGEYDSLAIKIINSGKGDLSYNIINSIQNEPASGQVMSVSPSFQNQDSSKIDQLYNSQSTSAVPARSVNIKQNTLNKVLWALDVSSYEITSLIPDIYYFSEGNSGYGISDGGNNMYDYGNNLSTSIGDNIWYTNRVITNSMYFNNESYFTVKYPGLFVLAANMSDVSSFTIDGYLGSQSTVDGSVLEMTVDGTSYTGFVKRVYDGPAPSVNHLIIVPSANGTSQSFSTSSYTDLHTVSGLEHTNRIYYLLFASQNGGYVDDKTMLKIMNTFLNNVVPGNHGSVSSGDSTEAYVHFNSNYQNPGVYQYDILVNTNDPDNRQIKVPTELTIKESAALDIADNFDFGTSYVGAKSTINATLFNPGNSPLVISGTDSSNPSVFTIDHLPDTLKPKKSTTVNVNFYPKEVKDYTGSITIKSNTPKGSFTVNVTGSGLNSSIISVNDSLISDTLKIGQKQAISSSVTNTGTEKLSYKAWIRETASIQNIDAQLKNIIQSAQSELAVTNSGNDNITPEQIAGYVQSSGTNTLLILASDEDAYIQEVVNQLQLTGQFSIIAYINTSLTDVSFSDVILYDAVLEWRSRYISLLNNNHLGDVLAEYVDAGGAVVTTMWESISSSGTLGGKWGSNPEKYALFNYERYYQYGYDNSEMSILQPNHPIFQNVDSLKGGYYSLRPSYGSNNNIINPKASILATWGDGTPLVILGGQGSEKRIDLGFYPPSSNVYYASWDSSTDGYTLIANCLNYVANLNMDNSPSWITMSKNKVDSLAAGATVDFTYNIDASDLSEGWHAALVNFAGNDSRGSASNSLVEIYARGTSSLDIPDTLTFEDVSIGFVGRATLPIRNIGSGKTFLKIEQDTTSEFYTVFPDTIEIAPYSGLALQLDFAPKSTGQKSEHLTVINLADGNSYQVLLAAQAQNPGIIRIEPDQIDLSVEYQGKTSSSFVIHNDGDGDLKFSMETFNFRNSLKGATQNQVSHIEFTHTPDKGEIDLREGHNIIYGKGADSFGYTYSDSNEPDGPSYSWDDISTTGVSLKLGDDDLSDPIQLPFEFNFYGNGYKQLFVASNGLIGFVKEGMTSPINMQIPGVNAPSGFISPFWKDLSPNNGGTISYDLNQDFVKVQFTGIPDYDDSGNFTFQVILYRSGDIQFLYQSMTGNVNDATIGTESASGIDGLQIAFNTRYLSNQMAIHIAHPIFRIEPEITFGKVAPNDSLKIPFTYNALDSYGGSYYQQIPIVSNDTINPVSFVDLNTKIQGATHISAYRDTIMFDTLYVDRQDLKPLWFHNDSVGVLSINKLTPSAPNFFALMPSYQAEYIDQDSAKLSFEIATNLGQITGRISGINSEVIGAKVYSVSNSETKTIYDLKLDKVNDQTYATSRPIVLEDLSYALANGNLFINVYTVDQPDGIKELSFESLPVSVNAYQYSEQFLIGMQAAQSGSDEATFTVESNAINSLTLKGIGYGLVSNSKIEVSVNSISESLHVNDSSETLFTIKNTGSEDLEFSLDIAKIDYTSNLYPVKLNYTSSINDSLPVSNFNQLQDQPEITTSTFFLYVRQNYNQYFGSGEINSSKNLSPFYNSYQEDPSSTFSSKDNDAMFILEKYGTLSYLDLKTGYQTYINNYSGDGYWVGLAKNPYSGEMYAATATSLYRFDSVSLDISYVGKINLGNVVDITWAENEIYAINGQNQIFQINKTTGAGENPVSLDLNNYSPEALGYHSFEQKFYLSAKNSPHYNTDLLRIDFVDGTTEVVRNIISNDYYAKTSSLLFPTIQGQNFFRATPMKGIISAGGEITINGKFNSKRLYNGKYYAPLTITSNDYSHPKVKVPVSLEVTGNKPKVGYYGKYYNFGQQTVMDTIQRYFMLSNDGGEVLKLVLKKENLNFFSDYAMGDTITIDVKSSISLQVGFVPTEATIYDWKMVFQTNDSTQSEISIAFSGAGKRALAAINPSFLSHDIEMARNRTDQVDFTLTSVGVDTVIYTLEVADSIGWMTADSVSGKLAPDSSLVYSIAMNTESMELGDYTGNIHLISNDPMYADIMMPVNLTVFNNPIVQTGTFDDQIVAIGGDTLRLDVPWKYTDADMDTIHFDAMSNFDFVAIAMENDTTLNIIGQAYGEDSVSVTAYDGYGDTLRMSFHVMSNHPPKLSKDLSGYDNPIPRTIVKWVDLDDYFTDADGNTISYELDATSHNSELALDNNNVVLINAKTVGKDTLTIIASDAYNQTSVTVVMNYSMILGTDKIESLKVYPIPTDDYLNVSFNKESDQVNRIEITDLTGRQLHSQEVNSGGGLINIQLKVNHLDAGVYFIRFVRKDGSTVNHRFIKK